MLKNMLLSWNMSYGTTFNFPIALKILAWSSLQCDFRIGKSKITL